MTCDIIMNGAAIKIEEGTTIGALLDERGVERRMVAVELNGEIIPRYDFDTTPIRAGDQLELLQMVGGG
jgi:sulfur carrier protein